MSETNWNSEVASTTPVKIFLSYGHDSSDDAHALKADLERRGHEVWLDSDRLLPGCDWETRIEEGLRWCDQVVLLMTPHAVRRRDPADPQSTDGYALNEITKAIQCGKRIVPVMLAWLDEGPPTTICRWQWVDMTACRPLKQSLPVYSARFKQLVDAIEKGELPWQDDHARVMEELDPTDFRAEIGFHLENYHDRCSIKAQVDEWLTMEGGPRILWVTGGAGEGKSAFAVNVCHYRADAFYMCVHNHSHHNDPRVVFKTIAFQLATHLPEYFRRLSKLHNLGAKSGGAPEIFRRLLRTPLLTNDFPDPGRVILVVIDGLDEASLNGKNELAREIAENVPHLPSWLRFIITSRADQALISQFSDGVKRLPLSRDQNENYALIRSSFEQCLVEFGVAHDVDLLDSLTAKTEGVFLYAAKVMEGLRGGTYTVAELEDLPPGIYGWYLSEFQRHFRNTKKYKQELAPILTAIVSQRGPLPLSTIQQALRISKGELGQILGRLGTLFMVRQESGGESTIQPWHSSLREWLTSIDDPTHIPIAGEYYINIEDGDKFLANHGWHLYERGELPRSAYHFSFLPEHLVATQQLDRLRQLLTDSNLLVEAFRQGRNYEWMRHWRRTDLDPVREFSPVLERLEEVGPDREQQVEYAEAIGSFLRDLGLTGGALPFLERATELRQGGTAELSIELATSLRNLAELHRLEKNFKKALGLYRRALAIYHRHVGPRSPEVATVYYDLGLLYQEQGRYTEALSYNQRSLQLRESLEPTDYRGLGDCICHTGVMLRMKGSAVRAEDYFQRALELSQKHFGAEDPQTAAHLHNIGELHKNSADNRDLSYLRRALKILEANFLPHHNDVQVCRRTLVRHLEVRGHYLDAVNQRQISLENSTSSVGADSRQAAIDRMSLESCRRHQRELAGRIDEARQQIMRVSNAETESRERAQNVLEQFSQLVGKKQASGESPGVPAEKDLAEVLFQLGAYLQDAGYFAAAFRFLDLALAVSEQQESNTDLVLRILTRLSATQCRSEEYRDAIGYELRCFDRLQGRTPLHIQAIVDSCHNLLFLCSKIQDHKAALERIPRAIEAIELARGPESEEAARARRELATSLSTCAMAFKNEHADFGAAEDYYRLSLELEPGDATILGNLAVLLTNGLGRHDEAEDVYRASLEISRTNPTIVSNFAFFLQHVRRDPKKAQCLYDEALRIPPAEPNTYCNYASLLIAMGKRSQAAEMLHSAWELHEDELFGARILFVKAVLELLEGRDATHYWGQLRFMLETGIVLSPWPATEFLVFVERELPAEQFPLIRSIASALSNRGHLEELLKTPEWQSSSFVPPDEEWPRPTAPVHNGG